MIVRPVLEEGTGWDKGRGAVEVRGRPHTMGHQPGQLHVSAGAVENASSLFTYDSRLLVNNFLYRPKHDPTFQPLFPEEITPSPSQVIEAAELCGDNHFCSFDVAATGSLSVGNATRLAYQLHQHRVQSLQPGKGCRRVPLQGGRHFTLGHGLPGWQLRRPVAQGCQLCSILPQWCLAAGWPRPTMGSRRASGT